MKKSLLLSVLIVLLFLPLAAFASGAKEPPQQITALISGDESYPQGPSWIETGIDKLHRDFPNATVKVYKIDLSTGAAITMDAMIAAGNAPNILFDTTVRTAKYMVPDFALALNGYIRDLGEYEPSALAPYTKNGEVLALPIPGDGQAMAVNLDITRAVGFTVKPDWTTDDFLRMAALVKAKYGDTKWATGMFAGNQSGDYLINNWFAAFGAKFYQNGDYSRTTIESTGGAKVYQFFQTLVRDGYVPPNSATLVDDDYVMQWAGGQLAATAFFNAWAAPYFKTAIAQGLITKPFDYEFVPFPRAPGVEKVPAYYSNAVLIVHKTGTIKDTVAARLVEYLDDQQAQTQKVLYINTIPTRLDVTVSSSDPHVAQVEEIVKANGIQDTGLTDPRFNERRAQEFPILQKVLSLAISPEAAIAEYAAKLDAVK